MNNNKYIYLISALIVLLLSSACGAKSDPNSTGIIDTERADNSENEQTNSAETEPANNGESNESITTDKEILIIIDQTPKPIEGNSFDFGVNKIPEGYALAEMQWVSEQSKIVNTTAEAIEHGRNGEDGFYISGNGQFSGFFYPDDMKGEEGQVAFRFKNDQGDELTWEKKLTLN
ncbi:hypothetical protein EBB07_25505 [Paenibacillaceae bacterium]|nr:hypothetical protein EBB07_25505 [Paenibacillaceae bacterium]